jgi:hypothetical protein
MLSLSLIASRSPPLRSLFSPFNVVARHITGATLPTRRDINSVEATSDNSIDQITDILDVADLSTSPQSNKFSGKLLMASPSQLPHLVLLAP